MHFGSRLLIVSKITLVMDGVTPSCNLLVNPGTSKSTKWSYLSAGIGGSGGTVLITTFVPDSVTLLNVIKTSLATTFKQFAVAFGTWPTIVITTGALTDTFVAAVPCARGLIPQAEASAADVPSAGMSVPTSVPSIDIWNSPGLVSLLAVTCFHVESFKVETFVSEGKYTV